MKYALFKLFNRTFGLFLRASRMALIDKTPENLLHYQVNQKAIQDSVDYALANFSKAMIFSWRHELWDFCLTRIPSLQTENKDGGGIIAEFGVWKGESINYFAKKCPNSLVYGFDSFEGLEEDWYGYTLRKGTFSTAGKLPKCEKNVELFKGWFEETVPIFKNKLKQSQIQILHMDADTYKPTSYVLNSLSVNLSKGTIVIFDEYFGYPNFQLHEFKAWQEFVDSNGLEYRYIGYTGMQVAIEIL
jgi:hypothetical protein